MPRSRLIYRCLLISPGDVEEERNAIEHAAVRWNAHVGEGLDARIEVVRWESHARPDMTGPPQTVLNKQLVDTCDFGIAVFWSRLGTPTRGHPSGSVEEIERLLERKCRVMVYFSKRDVPQSRLVDDQFQRLLATRTRYRDRGLLAEYSTAEELAGLVTMHMTALANELLLEERAHGQPIPAVGTLTAPTPDIRVHVRSSMATRQRASVPMVQVTVENHSPVNFFLAGMELTDRHFYVHLVHSDGLTGLPVAGHVIEPGDSWTVHVDLMKVTKGSHARLVDVVVVDKIRRRFLAQKGSLELAATHASERASTLQQARRRLDEVEEKDE